ALAEALAQDPKAAVDSATAGVDGLVLRGISLGAVFMGAMTYIGNGPNFMVKAIAEKSGVRMPSFFGYMAYSCAVLLPVFALTSWRYLGSDEVASQPAEIIEVRRAESPIPAIAPDVALLPAAPNFYNCGPLSVPPATLPMDARWRRVARLRTSSSRPTNSLSALPL
ncbi:MAG: sodium:proton antiporter, partial [Planctomycetota bacterium]